MPLVQRDFVLVDRTVATDRNTEHEITVLAHDVDQHINNLTDCFVLVLCSDFTAVVPRPDASICLPGLRTNAGSHATLDVFNKCGRVFWLHVFGIHHGFKSALTKDACIVKVRHDIKAGLAQREKIYAKAKLLARCCFVVVSTILLRKLLDSSNLKLSVDRRCSCIGLSSTDRNRVLSFGNHRVTCFTDHAEVALF